MKRRMTMKDCKTNAAGAGRKIVRPYAGKRIFRSVALLDDTIYNNIKCARPGAMYDEIMDVADRSGVIDFAWELPEGLHSRIDKKGSGLSNAQKQCIEIARRMLKYGC